MSAQQQNAFLDKAGDKIGKKLWQLSARRQVPVAAVVCIILKVLFTFLAYMHEQEGTGLVALISRVKNSLMEYVNDYHATSKL